MALQLRTSGLLRLGVYRWRAHAVCLLPKYSSSKLLISRRLRVSPRHSPRTLLGVQTGNTRAATALVRYRGQGTTLTKRRASMRGPLAQRRVRAIGSDDHVKGLAMRHG